MLSAEVVFAVLVWFGGRGEGGVGGGRIFGFFGSSRVVCLAVFRWFDFGCWIWIGGEYHRSLDVVKMFSTYPLWYYRSLA